MKKNKFGLIVIEINPKYIWIARTLLILATIPFLNDLIDAFMFGEYTIKGMVRTASSNGSTYYSGLLLQLTWVAFLMYLAAIGLTPTSAKDVKKNEDQIT